MEFCKLISFATKPYHGYLRSMPLPKFLVFISSNIVVIVYLAALASYTVSPPDEENSVLFIVEMT